MARSPSSSLSPGASPSPSGAAFAIIRVEGEIGGASLTTLTGSAAGLALLGDVLTAVRESLRRLYRKRGATAFVSRLADAVTGATLSVSRADALNFVPSVTATATVSLSPSGTASSSASASASMLGSIVASATQAMEVSILASGSVPVAASSWSSAMPSTPDASTAGDTSGGDRDGTPGASASPSAAEAFASISAFASTGTSAAAASPDGSGTSQSASSTMAASASSASGITVSISPSSASAASLAGGTSGRRALLYTVLPVVGRRAADSSTSSTQTQMQPVETAAAAAAAVKPRLPTRSSSHTASASASGSPPPHLGVSVPSPSASTSAGAPPLPLAFTPAPGPAQGTYVSFDIAVDPRIGGASEMPALLDALDLAISSGLLESLVSPTLVSITALAGLPLGSGSVYLALDTSTAQLDPLPDPYAGTSPTAAPVPAPAGPSTGGGPGAGPGSGEGTGGGSGGSAGGGKLTAAAIAGIAVGVACASLIAFAIGMVIFVARVRARQFGNSARAGRRQRRLEGGALVHTLSSFTNAGATITVVGAHPQQPIMV